MTSYHIAALCNSYKLCILVIKMRCRLLLRPETLVTYLIYSYFGRSHSCYIQKILAPSWPQISLDQFSMYLFLRSFQFHVHSNFTRWMFTWTVSFQASAHQKNLDVGANLFIGNLDPEVDEKMLYDIFSAFGVILQTPKVSENNQRDSWLSDYESCVPRTLDFSLVMREKGVHLEMVL